MTTRTARTDAATAPEPKRWVVSCRRGSCEWVYIVDEGEGGTEEAHRRCRALLAVHHIGCSGMRAC